MHEVEIGGRRFDVIRWDAEKGIWPMTPFRRALFMKSWRVMGLGSLTELRDTDVDDNEYLNRLARCVEADPRHIDILATLLRPRGMAEAQFTEDVAIQTAAHLRAVEDGIAPAQILQLIGEGIDAFF